MKTKVLWVGLWFAMALPVSSQDIPPLTTVPLVDLERYAGFWHEIARLPNSFERNCAHSTAEYRLREDGQVDILNRCTKANGATREAHGIARIVDSTTHAKLEVNFVPKWLRWTGLGTGDYWIIDLEPNYQYAVVSEPEREYLWILSRTSALPRDTYDAIISRLKQMHFDLTHLISTMTPTF